MVLLACFQCVDTLAFVLKHAEGMSLRCDVILPSLIVAGMNHRILSRLTRIPLDSTIRWFVEICVNLWLKNLCKKNCVNSEICGLKPQIFTNYFGLNGLSLNNFIYLCLYAFQKTVRVMTTSNPHRHTKKRLMKTVGAHTLCSCGYIQNGGLYFYIKDYQGNVRVVLNQANFVSEADAEKVATEVEQKAAEERKKRKAKQ